MISANDFRKIVPDRLAEFEESIDDALAKAAALGKRGANVAVAGYEDVVVSVARRYEDNGWSVVRVADGRDGDYLEFNLP